MTPRLYLPAVLRDGELAVLSAEQAHHLAQVLRLPVGRSLQVFDGRGHRHHATIETLRKHQGTLRIGPALAANRLDAPRITLVQGIASADKMDWAIEKATELGVARIVPLLAQRGKVRLDADRAARRHDHWQRLVIAACMQCGRDELVDLAAVTDWSTLPALLDPASPRLLLAPPTDGRPASRLSEWARARPYAPAVTLLVGPESGFSDAEQSDAVSIGFEPVSLGPRILRTETAGLAAIATLQAIWGDA
ncbi:MAG: 16S rRNA (uracil(1498)-N(3))-methyltransferase [Burkholderiaceae bacterium]